MKMRRLALIVGGLVVLAGLWATLTESGRVFTGRWSFTEKAEIDRGTYFRLKVDFAYKGEPQHFDIVVGCNVLNIRYKDGSGTYEAGLVPTVYGRRMSDGKAVVVRPPDACRRYDGQWRRARKLPSRHDCLRRRKHVGVRHRLHG